MKDRLRSPVRFLELEREKRRKERDKASSRPLAHGVEVVLGKIAPAKSRDPLSKLQEVRELWVKIVGREIARRTEPQRWREGVLTVAVDTTPLASELQSFGEQALVADLAESGLDGIHSIRFETGHPRGVARGEGYQS